MTRIKASAIHLGISAAVAATLAALFWFVIYPVPTLNAVGGGRVFLMLLGIDIVLGPLLTLVVYKQGKKTLKFDLTVIACLQLAAMAYGVSVLWSARPLYVAAIGHRFDLVQAMDLQEDRLPLANQNIPLLGMKRVGTRKADSLESHQKIHVAAISGIDYGHYPEYHVPIESMASEIIEKSDSIESLLEVNKGREGEIRQWLSAYGLTAQTARTQLLRTRGTDLTIILKVPTAEIVGITDFTPYIGSKSK